MLTVLFNSIAFVAFASVFFAGWAWAKRSDQARWGYLVAFSFFFYGYWDPRYLALLTASGLLDFTVGRLMERHPQRKRALLALSIAGNLGCLSTFKYLGFGMSAANDLLALLGLPAQLEVISLTLPVGISFYTFQSMSYTIDIYRGQTRATRHPLHFLAYLSLFPQLVAGPIVRAGDLMPQLARPPRASTTDLMDGLWLIARGYFKKLVIADGMAGAVARAFAEDGGSSAHAWLAAAMFAVQIYADFSGYTDIARGLGRMMGLRYGDNFNYPYIAVSLRDFWQRWHISLSTWFRDYLYIPLGGSRRGVAHGLMAMAVTMVVSGLWHGAAWTFVTWGALHAVYLGFERLTQWPGWLDRLPGGRALCVALTLAQVLVAWVFFRADTSAQAIAMVGRMFSFDFADTVSLALTHQYELLLILLVVVEHGVQTMDGLRRRLEGWLLAPALRPMIIAATLAVAIVTRGPGEAFVYFQF